MRKLILFSSILLLTGCMTMTRNLNISLIDPPSETNTFENKHLKILFTFEPTPTLPGNPFSDKAIIGVDFNLTNKTKSPLKIIWDDISLMVDGQAHRVIHSGVSLADRDKPQAPTTIPPASFIQDHIVPADNISFLSTSSGGSWFYYNLIKSSSKNEHTIRVYIPYTFEGETYYIDCKFIASKMSNSSQKTNVKNYDNGSDDVPNLINDIELESLLSENNFKFIEIRKILKNYVLIYSDENTSFKLNDIYEIIRESKSINGKTEYNKIGSAKVKKIQDNKVVLEIEDSTTQIQIGDKIKYF